MVKRKELSVAAEAAVATAADNSKSIREGYMGGVNFTIGISIGDGILEGDGNKGRVGNGQRQ